MSREGIRLVTLQLLYPRFIHAELMTHRVFSRNASSSRAIPVKRMLEMVRNEPAMPIHWGKNQPGMQANEQLIGANLINAKTLWLKAAENAANIAEQMNTLGLHKQVANRILEPFQHISVVLTATEFTNWESLRAHPDAQPEIQALAVTMQEAMQFSKPKVLEYGEWHLPYVTREERETYDISVLKRISAARCCRVSYLKHDGSASDVEEDISLCDRLAGSIPIHASPFEHQATPAIEECYQLSNFRGWNQFRKEIENEVKRKR